MKNKGFTLIELIGVIVLLSLLVLIFVPLVEKTVKKGNERIDTQNKETIILAAKNWTSDNKEKIPTTISIEKLQAQGYVDSNIKNPKTNKIIRNVCIEITKKNNIIDYKYIEKCRGDESE